MKIINVDLKGGKYKINVGIDSYDVLKQDLVSAGGKVFLIADKKAYEFHKEKILAALPEKPAGIWLVSGEIEKNMTTVSNILEAAAECNITRSDCFVAFGGGVCGDIAGFCSAIFLRGIDYYQVPTTLLSQVDSSVGGKTGVDLKAGKNLAGCFKQPKGVYIDVDVLKTLSIREKNQGKAEMLKAAMIYDAELFEEFEKGRIATIENILRCIEIKLEFVKDDEFDKGKRMILNFGHTIAHALEKKIGYGKLPHGEAVAIGMALITEISENMGISKKGTAKKVKEIIITNGLPVKSEIKVRELEEEMAKDKKNLDGYLNLILLKKVGEAGNYRMSIEEFLEFAGDL